MIKPNKGNINLLLQQYAMSGVPHLMANQQMSLALSELTLGKCSEVCSAAVKEVEKVP